MPDRGKVEVVERVLMDALYKRALANENEALSGPSVTAMAGAVLRGIEAYEIGGVCRPEGKCGGGCETAHKHRLRLAMLAVERS